MRVVVDIQDAPVDIAVFSGMYYYRGNDLNGHAYWGKPNLGSYDGLHFQLNSWNLAHGEKADFSSSNTFGFDRHIKTVTIDYTPTTCPTEEKLKWMYAVDNSWKNLESNDEISFTCLGM